MLGNVTLAGKPVLASALFYRRTRVILFFFFLSFFFCEQLALLATHSEGSKPFPHKCLARLQPRHYRPTYLSCFPFPGENTKEDRSTSMQIYDSKATRALYC